jgi:hypothetical protein
VLQEELPQQPERQPVYATLRAATLQLLTDQRPPLDQLVLVQPLGHAGKLPTTRTTRTNSPHEWRPVTRSLPMLRPWVQRD